jgi:hypothetical protein
MALQGKRYDNEIEIPTVQRHSFVPFPVYSLIVDEKIHQNENWLPIALVLFSCL